MSWPSGRHAAFTPYNELSIKPAETGKGKNPTEKIMGKPCFAAGFPLISWIGVPLDRRIVERTETL